MKQGKNDYMTIQSSTEGNVTPLNHPYSMIAAAGLGGGLPAGIGGHGWESPVVVMSSSASLEASGTPPALKMY